MRWAAIIGGAVGVFVLGALILVLLAPIPLPVVEPAETTPPQPAWAEPGPPPVASADPHAGIQTRVDADWARQTAAATGISILAVKAYAGAAMDKAAQMPECGLSWTTLAGVGLIESHHGTYGGSKLDAHGTAKPGIFGIALDGVTTANVPDSDDGKIDGDKDADRAVGPMQLIPQTWRNWHIDGGADGVEDPQNIYDAALAAANYLCRSSTDMDTKAGWRAAISAYNSSDSYLSNVAAAAKSYNAALAG